MFVIGIDLSINYPGLCICENFDTFEFVGFVNDPKISNAKLSHILSETRKYDGVDIVDISRERKTTDTYHVNERNKLINLDRIVSSIVLELKKRISPADLCTAVAAMEGISYGSKGSALVDICMLTGAFRRGVLNGVLDGNASRFFVFSPSELKNSIGLKGNATKTEVLAQFMDDPGIGSVRGSGMYSFMRDHVLVDAGREYVYNEAKDEIHSPFNDMIDAYLSVLKIYNIMH